jgi:DNA-binding transcriptional ArsR family regulator
MSPKRPKLAARRSTAFVFAALGDDTRLALVSRLARGQPCSISKLTADSRLTRQAVTKHLHVLERAGLVHGVKQGRENRFQLDPRPISGMKEYLDLVSEQWGQTLTRLKEFVEK